MPVALLPIILQLVSAGLTVAPQVIAAAKTELDLLRAGAPPPTDAQKAEIDAALELANDTLQAAQPAP